MKENIALFSAFKENSFKNTLQDLLTDGDRVRPWSEYEKLAYELDKDYNERWRAAEYNKTVSSATAALQWQDYQGRKDLYPNLRWDTVMDGRARTQHAAWNGLTLNLDHPFWKKHYPGTTDWGCRCGAEQTDDEEDTKEIDLDDIPDNKDGFNHNPGISGKVFDKGHPYFDVPAEEKQKVEESLKSYQQEDRVPKALADYEKKLGVEVDKSMFTLLKKDTPLYLDNPPGSEKYGKGAYYHPGENFVKIPIDARRKKSKWYAKAVVHHEYGHAIDNQLGLRGSQKIKDLMEDARTLYPDKDLKKMYKDALKNGLAAKDSGDHDLIEKSTAILDTIASIRPGINMNKTHSDAYWKREGMPEAEFIAHLFENKYASNDAFEKAMPELYKKMKDFEFD